MGDLGGNLSHEQAGPLSGQLHALPGYADALSGRINAGQFPTGADGLVLPGFREMNARYFAEQHGVSLGSGSHIDPSGDVHAVNDQPWYADPRWLGPITVGALSAGAGAFGGGGGTSATTDGGYIGTDVAHTAAQSLVPAAGTASIPTVASASEPLWHKIAKLAAPVAATVLPRLVANPGGPGGGGPTTGTPPELSALLADAMKRMQSQQPLFDSVNRQAQAGLPTYAQKGGQ